MKGTKLMQSFFKPKIILFFILYSTIWYIVLSIPIITKKYLSDFVITFLSHINHVLFIPSITIINIILNFPSFQLSEYSLWNWPILS